MRWSIKSFLARIANRNSCFMEATHEDNTDNSSAHAEATTLARMNDSSYYQSIQSTASAYISASGQDITDLFLSEDEEESPSMDIIVQLSQDVDGNAAPQERRLRFSVDLNQNLLEMKNNQLMISGMSQKNKIAIKSIIKSPTKARKDTARRKTRMQLNKEAWQKAGFLWKEKPTLSEKKFMILLWEMMSNDQQWEEVADDILQCTQEVSTRRLYDLDSYEIIERPPSVLDLTVYDDDADEFGVFFNQRFIVTNYLMEGSPCGLCQPDINTGLRMIRKPLSKHVRTATIVDSYELAPVYWTSPNEFTGEYLEDAQEEARYKALQKEMTERCNRKDFHSNPNLEEFKNGTWRLTIFEESEEAMSLDARRSMTSEEIQKMFGLSEAGSIILNVDHIDVVQGKCGFNRGKATRRFMVPLGQEAVKRDRMRDIRRKWSGLFSSYTIAFGNLFGEDDTVIPNNIPF